MIDKEGNSDLTMDHKSVEEPPPYSRRQASTSNARGRLRSPNSPTRFVAPPPMPSPQLVISPAEHYDGVSGPNVPSKGDPRNGSFVDLAEKPASPKTGEMYGDFADYRNSGMPGYLDQSAMGSSFSVPSTSSGGVNPAARSPTTTTRKGTDTLIMMGTGTSGMWLNHVVVANKGDPIQGHYHIDPNLEVPDHATPRRVLGLSKKAHSRSTSSLSTSSKSGKRKADPSWHPTTAPEPCNAFFETKNGNVDIVLTIGGVGFTRSQRASIDVRAKQGKAVIKVIEILDGRRLNLDVATGKGEIEVFLPRNFAGPLHVHTEGEITLLPRLAAAMEVISAREDDALVMIAPSTKAPASPTPSSSSRSYHDQQAHRSTGGLSQWLHPSGGAIAQSYQGDFANIVSSAGGNIKVGFIDEDKVKEESPGMWTKFVRMFGGRSNSS